MRRLNINLISSCAMGLAMALLLIPGSSSFADTAPIPTVEPVAPDGNLPFNSAMYSGSLDYGDFAVNGYVEKEYYFSGKASTRDQETGAVLKADLPYVSRMVVRMPADPKAFSGNVVIEPFHAVMEKSEMWEQLHRYITKNGDIWVGYTDKAYGVDMEPTASYTLGGIPALKAYDPVRYGRLQLEPDMRPLMPAPPAPMPPQALDLMTQVGALLKSNDPGSPLRGLTVKRLYAIGSGINGEIVSGYLRTGRHDTWTLPGGGQIFDGYFYGILGRMPPAPPKNAVHIMYRGTNEIDRAATAGFIGKSPNTPAYHVYDIVGLSHLNARDLPDNQSVAKQLNAVLPKPDLNMPYVLDNGGKCPNMNDEPVDLMLGALFVRMEEWGKTGRPLPDAPDPELLPGQPGAPLGDPSGKSDPMHDTKVTIVKLNPVTGTMMAPVLLPWVEAPVASYPVLDPRFAAMMMARAPGDIIHGGAPIAPGAAPPPPIPMPSGPPIEPSDAWPRESKDKPQLPTKPGGIGFCFLFNPRVPLDKEKLHQLYKSYDDYVQKFDAAKTKAVQAGWLLKEDADELRPRGQPQDF